jgi:hypothetical protein
VEETLGRDTGRDTGKRHREETPRRDTEKRHGKTEQVPPCVVSKTS